MSNEINNSEMDKLLENIYSNPTDPGSFGGFDRLYKNAKKSNKKIRRKDVENYLRKTDTYTLHRDMRKHFPRQKTIVPGIDHQWQADLVVIPDLSIYNDNYPNILTVIDVFSKYAFVEPLKSKQGTEIINAFRKIFEKSNRKPIKLQTDKGTEFLNLPFQNFLKSMNIEFFTSFSDLKAAVCERFNRTLKARMWRYLTKNNTKRYIDILQDLVKSYNNSYHRSIGIEPINVSFNNQSIIWQRLYGKIDKISKKSKPKFFVNQPVRLNILKGTFEKGYTGNWILEIFYIDKIYDQYLPFMYRVRDSSGEKIKGRFYDIELQPIIVQKDKEYLIEKIVKRRKLKGKKPEVLIKWLGYPDSANSWESESNIHDLRKNNTIEKIVKRRKLKGKRPEVLIKWLGYPESSNSWEPQANVKHYKKL